MSHPVTRTKFILPRRRTDLISRPRLLDLVADLLDQKLIIVAAPAGYGKTSLLVDMAYHTDMPVCWYSIDPLDREFSRFVTYLIASINQRFPAFGPISELTLKNLPPDLADIDALVTTMTNEIYETIQEHFLIVLDDYHLIDGQEPINRFLGAFLQAMGENCHIAIASRTLLTLPDLPLMVARSQVGGLGFDQLAFQPEEIRQLIQQNQHVLISDQDVAELSRLSEGWITGLLLSTQMRGKGLSERLRLASMSSDGLYDYLIQQVLDQQSPSVRDFLLRTSLLEEFDAELCEAVFGPPAYPGGETWRSLMDQVLHDNLFILPVGEKGQWLRYHHLFRDFLQSRLSLENPTEAAQITRALAKVYTQRQEWDKAYTLFQRMGDTTDVVEMIEQAGSLMIKNGRLTTLAAWIDALPERDLASHPVVLSVRGSLAVMLGEIERGLVLLNAAETALRQSGDAGQLAMMLSRRAHAYQNLGKYSEAIQDTLEAIRICGGDKQLLPAKALAHRTLGMNLYRTGQWDKAVDQLQESANIYDILGNIESLGHAQIDLGNIYNNSGYYSRARLFYNSALQSTRKVGDLARQAVVLNNLGVLGMWMGDYEHVSTLFDQALAAAQQSGYLRMEGTTLASIGDLYRDLDAFDAAKFAYDQAYEIATRINHGYLRFYIELAQTHLAVTRRDIAKASQSLARALKFGTERNSPYENGGCNLAAGRVALALGNLEDAQQKFLDAVDQYHRGHHRIEEAQAHFLLSRVLFEMGRHAEMIAHFQQVFELVQGLESQHLLTMTARQEKAFLDKARGIREAAGPIAGLLEKITQFETRLPRLRRQLRRQASIVPFTAPRLTIRSLGRTQVLADGKVVNDIGWQSQAARELFFLLLNNPDGLPKETIGAILWKDSSPTQLKLQFKNAIYRIRHALSQEIIVLEEDVYRFNHALDYDYDVETFTIKVDQSQEATLIEKQISMLQTAIQLYKGPYLPDILGSWVIPERERLQQLYQVSMVRLSNLLFTAGRHHEALDTCQQILVMDPCLEEAYRIAMRVHAQMGNTAAVVRQYERCQQNLLHEFSIPPSPQTQSLYESLVH